jgi:hypothetical protein
MTDQINYPSAKGIDYLDDNPSDLADCLRDVCSALNKFIHALEHKPQDLTIGDVHMMGYILDLWGSKLLKADDRFALLREKAVREYAIDRTEGNA